MNSVVLIGRLTKDPELRYTPNNQTAIANFTLAIDRPMGQNREKSADFIRITVFGKQAETVDRYLSKGRQVAVQGRIQTGSYTNKEGKTVYTTDVIGERVEFLGSKGDFSGRSDYGQGGGLYGDDGAAGAPDVSGDGGSMGIPDVFESTQDDVPF